MTQRQLGLLVSILAGTVLGFSILFFAHPATLALGSFIVLGITLIALILYAYDTNRIANVTEKRWESELTPLPIYSMHYTPGSELLSIVLTNGSRYFVTAWVSCNLRLNGKSLAIRPDFDGTAPWRLFPYQSWTKVASLDQVLAPARSSIKKLRRQATPQNREKQLTMDPEFRFENELGRTRSLPPRRHFFDIKGGRLVPVDT